MAQTVMNGGNTPGIIPLRRMCFSPLLVLLPGLLKLLRPLNLLLQIPFKVETLPKVIRDGSQTDSIPPDINVLRVENRPDIEGPCFWVVLHLPTVQLKVTSLGCDPVFGAHQESWVQISFFDFITHHR